MAMALEHWEIEQLRANPLPATWEEAVTREVPGHLFDRWCAEHQHWLQYGWRLVQSLQLLGANPMLHQLIELWDDLLQHCELAGVVELEHLLVTGDVSSAYRANGYHSEGAYAPEVQEVEAAARERVLANADHIRATLAGAYDAFLADVAESVAPTVGAPEQAAFGWEQIDWAVVDAVNERTLKDAAPGHPFPYWQYGDLVLLGQHHAPPYYQFVVDSGGWTGAVTLDAKGRGLSAGAITVDQCLAPGPFKEAIRRFSKKKVYVA